MKYSHPRITGCFPILWCKITDRCRNGKHLLKQHVAFGEMQVAVEPCLYKIRLYQADVPFTFGIRLCPKELCSPLEVPSKGTGQSHARLPPVKRIFCTDPPHFGIAAGNEPDRLVPFAFEPTISFVSHQCSHSD